MILLNSGITQHMKPMQSSNFVSSVAAVLLLYVLNAFILVFLVSGVSKIVMLLFAIMPFIIGKCTEYKTHGFYSNIQSFTVFCSIIYTMYLFV